MTTFRTTIELAGKTATGFPVPPEALEALGGGKRPAVVVTVAGYGYRSTVGTMGGRAMVPLSAEHRAGAGVGAGDEVDVELVLDTAPRVVEPPEDLAAALAGAPGAGPRSTPSPPAGARRSSPAWRGPRRRTPAPAGSPRPSPSWAAPEPAVAHCGRLAP